MNDLLETTNAIVIVEATDNDTPTPDPVATLATSQPTAKRRLSERQARLLINCGMFALTLVVFLANADMTFAQVIGGTDKIKAGAKSITDFLKVCAGLSIVPLFSFFGFKMMFSGFSDAIQQKSVRGVGLAILGAGGIFLFADPIGSFINDSFNKPA